MYDGRAVALMPTQRNDMHALLDLLATLTAKKGSLEATIYTKDDQLTAIVAEKGSREASLDTKDVHTVALERDLVTVCSAAAASQEPRASFRPWSTGLGKSESHTARAQVLHHTAKG